MKQHEMNGIKARRIVASLGAALVATAICATSALADGIELWGADRYVQSGLIAQFDGLENTAYGAQHSDTATQWSSIGGTASGLKFSFSGCSSGAAPRSTSEALSPLRGFASRRIRRPRSRIRRCSRPAG